MKKYRIGAYVNRETWEIITDYQKKRIKAETGKKPTQGQVIDELVKQLEKKVLLFFFDLTEKQFDSLTEKQYNEHERRDVMFKRIKK